MCLREQLASGNSQLRFPGSNTLTLYPLMATIVAVWPNLLFAELKHLTLEHSLP